MNCTQELMLCLQELGLESAAGHGVSIPGARIRIDDALIWGIASAVASIGPGWALAAGLVGGGLSQNLDTLFPPPNTARALLPAPHFNDIRNISDIRNLSFAQIEQINILLENEPYGPTLNADDLTLFGDLLDAANIMSSPTGRSDADSIRQLLNGLTVDDYQNLLSQHQLLLQQQSFFVDEGSYLRREGEYDYQEFLSSQQLLLREFLPGDRSNLQLENWGTLAQLNYMFPVGIDSELPNLVNAINESLPLLENQSSFLLNLAAIPPERLVDLETLATTVSTEQLSQVIQDWNLLSEFLTSANAQYFLPTYEELHEGIENRPETHGPELSDASVEYNYGRFQRESPFYETILDNPELITELAGNSIMTNFLADFVGSDEVTQVIADRIGGVLNAEGGVLSQLRNELTTELTTVDTRMTERMDQHSLAIANVMRSLEALSNTVRNQRTDIDDPRNQRGYSSDSPEYVGSHHATIA